MDPLRVGLLLLAAWIVYLAIARLVGLIIRPGPVEPARPSRNLPDEPPPAVVNYLVNGCRVDPDASVATLLDLAARGYIEIEHSSVDPAQSLARALDVAPPGLTAYERRVLDRVLYAADLDGTVTLADLDGSAEGVQLAGGGAQAVPGGPQTAAEKEQWASEFNAMVAADAKAHGYIADRPVLLTMLVFLTGMLVAGGSAVALPLWVIGPLVMPADLDGGAAVVGYVGAILLLAALLVLVAMVPVARWLDAPHRTRSGRATTARWLGVEAWLRTHEDFTDTAPAAVTQYSRYLSYATALGITPTISQTIVLSPGNREVVWSRRSDGWRQLPVAYPRQGRRFGDSPAVIVGRNLAGLAVILGVAVLTRDDWSTQPPAIQAVLGAAAALLAARSAYRLARAIGDGLEPAVISGVVLATLSTPWLAGREERNRARKRRPWRRPATFLVIDDGRSHRATVWRVASSRLSQAARFEPGTRIRLLAYRWCHVASKIQVAQSTPTGNLALPQDRTIDAQA